MNHRVVEYLTWLQSALLLVKIVMLHVPLLAKSKTKLYLSAVVQRKPVGVGTKEL